MDVPKQTVLDLIRLKGNSGQIHQADEELPERVDPERDSWLLRCFGVKPRDVTARFGGRVSGA